MSQDKPLWHRVYFEPVFTEVARIVGYSGLTYRDLMEKTEPLRKRFGSQQVESAIYFLVTFEGDRTCNPKPLAHVSFRPEARKVMAQLLGFPPEYVPTDMIAEIVARGKQEPKPEPKPASKKRRKKIQMPTATPLPTTSATIMQQYKEAKERHPGMVLLFRMGDYYEVFEDDAELMVKVLGLTLTTREQTPMAGFPHHQLEGYLHKLLQTGHRIAVCDEVIESLPKGPIHREANRVITPANMVEDS